MFRITMRKHKRTRTGTSYPNDITNSAGCFTCRKRRVKCDEMKPICERCNKGKRECLFPSDHAPPDIRTPKKHNMSQSTDDSDFSTDAESLYSFSSAPIQAPSKTELISFFLNLHENDVTSSHYFRIYDPGDRCLHGLRNMAKQSEVLSYAIAAFSALVNSVKTGRAIKEQAFRFYDITVQKFRSLLNEIPKSYEEFQILVATALQLLAFDRYLGDRRKCIPHLTGVATIMQKYSDLYSSTPFSRALFQWYCELEDDCCLAQSCIPRLPAQWRTENIKSGHDLDSQHLTGSDCLLHDLYTQFLNLMPKYIDLEEGVMRLKGLTGAKQQGLARQLNACLLKFEHDVNGFYNSPQLHEVLKQRSIVHTDLFQRSDNLFPHFFIYRFELVPIAYLYIRLHHILACLAGVIRPTIRSFYDDDDVEADKGLASSHSIEIWRTFAGMDLVLAKYPDALLPCLPSVATAALTSPRNIRVWVWHKLGHFEKLSPYPFPCLKEKLALRWNMKELSWGG